MSASRRESPERPERAERPEHPEHPEHPDHPERPEHPGYPNNPEPPDHGSDGERRVALYGDAERPPVRHEGTLTAHLTHATAAERPLVHMVCWSEEACDVKLSGRVTLAGVPEAPLDVRMTHAFPEQLRQAHAVEPLDHQLRVSTAPARPIHHSLAMSTPLQLRFCNPWHIASDYTLDVTFGERRIASLRLTGATVATPQPCEDAPTSPSPGTGPIGTPGAQEPTTPVPST